MTGTETFYKSLKTHRETQGIQISEISDKTKINSKYFDAIENGQFSILPTVYIRLFLRTYCIEVGADFEQALKDFEKYTTGKVTEKTELKFQPVSDTANIKSTSKDDKLFNENFSRKNIIYVIIGIIIIFSLIQFVSYLSKEAESSVQPSVNKNESIIDEAGLALPNSELSQTDDLISYSTLPIPTLLEEDIVYNDNKLIEQNAYRLTVSPPFIFTVTSFAQTKVHISSITNTIFNGIMDGDETRTFTITDTLKFDFWSAQHVRADVNGVDLSSYITDSDLAIRGSLVPDGSLSIQQYSH
ncbi:MAG: helix-turn-helix domain-containing protein [Candidatus Marinimicrobia bacterium]|jgi:cytoskeletal protein RodZ|nr:helix-turn-helix domain-containing protein [Candidatus Neomarinimicrobiota bacterium]MBT3634159.1 helix-turn-helix domain-containing protein [Candidatus Neomarinimicrobiota bacterium]MBT3683196.1 helix-turn-helix domain-containing protein [Candidatus Neomarinimicrobiota bacterium]MBT3759756.1 helix-turn-helix domain-containing protein [Candidatus Neomarinimicrobiota bacterium]MBT3895838.1 helix-turn-helix domain-containing protein [Candidatus Neomarinimicrobiota bacterium]